MINPAKLLKFKKRWEEFQARHPKFLRYLGVVKNGYFGVGSILDVTVTDPAGKALHTNLRLTEEDVVLLNEVAELLREGK